MLILQVFEVEVEKFSNEEKLLVIFLFLLVLQILTEGPD